MSATIHFHIRLDRPSKDGSVPIYLIFLISRTQRTKISLGKNVPLKKQYKRLSVEDLLKVPMEERGNYYSWDEAAERVLPFTSKINNHIDKERARAISIIEKFEAMDRPLTIDLFQNAFSKPTGTANFADYFNQVIVKERANTVSPETLKNYSTTITKTTQFRPNLTLSGINYKFLNDYENYMLKPKTQGGLGNVQNTVAKTMRILRTFLNVAIKNGDFHKDFYPFKDYAVKQPDPVLTTRDYLEPEEIFKLEALLSPENIHKLHPGEIRGLTRFLGACYSGLRFKDIITLDWEKHIHSKWILNPKTVEMKLRPYIEISMNKTSRPVMIPLIDRFLELVGSENNERKGLVFGKISNRQMNLHLHEISKKAEIDKHLTFHVARHSFATICFLYGIPVEVGQRLLGHKNRKFTEIYTHLSTNKIFEEMDKLNSGLNQYEVMLYEHNNQISLYNANNPIQSSEALKGILPLLQNLSPDKLAKIADIVKMVA